MGSDAPRTRRHRFRSVLIGLLVTVLVLVTAGAGVGWWTVQRSFPTTSGTLDLGGLQHEVTVTRDDAGVPQVRARTDHDLFFAQGYVHAQDRFWEMDFRRHVTAGRLAEMFGASQVGTDTFIRTLGWRRVAEQEYTMLDDDTRALYQAYAQGVNAYLADHKGAEASLEYAVLGLTNPGYSPEKWTPVDSIAWLKAMAWDLRSNLEDEIDRALLSTALPPDQVAQLHPGFDFQRMPTILGGPAGATPAATSVEPLATTAPAATEQASVREALAQPGAVLALQALRTTLAGVPKLLGAAGSGIGSNSWVVSGALTATGKPLLANDPHLGPAMPSVWYQMGLGCVAQTADCHYDVSGYTFSGMPGVIIGHNARLAWGFTNLGPDVADLFLEKVTGDTYELDGVQHTLDVRTETIKVAGGKPVEITIRSTGRGPLVTGLTNDFTRVAKEYPAASGQPAGRYELSLEWTALTPGRTASAVFLIDRARNWAEFRAGASMFDVPAQNLIYADVDGHIGYQAPGDVPVRLSGDGTLPLPGWTSANGWSGRVPFDQMPNVYDPPRGIIVTANNAVQQGGPFLTQDWDLGYRADGIERRLDALVRAGRKLTASDLLAIQLDTRDENAARFLPVIGGLKLTGDAKRGADYLRGWNAHDDATSGQAAYFAVFWRNLLADMFGGLPDGTQPVGGDRWYAVVGALLDQPDSHWWHDDATGAAGRDQLISHALAQAWSEAGMRLGQDTSKWQWGRLHTLELTNQSLGKSGIAPIEMLFNRGPYRLGGGPGVVDAIGWDASVGYAVQHVPSMRMVVDLHDLDGSRWVNLTGASGHAFDAHYDDQAALWATGRTRPWAFTPKAVAAAAVQTLVLRPKRG